MNLLLKKILSIFFLFISINTFAQKQFPAATFTHVNGEITSVNGSFNVSGIYPHLTTYSHARVNGKNSYIPNEQWECGIGAIVEWAGKLYTINYAAHEPAGSEHKLYTIDKNLKMEIFSGSVGGTPAGRMVHKESNQLFIGHYAIDAKGNVRVIDIKKMPGRVTAIARHLSAPGNKVYYYMMEGELWEVDVNTLQPKMLYENPLPGWHGKGAYTSQGKLILTNNGEVSGAFEPTELWQVSSKNMVGNEKYGVLAEFDGSKFNVVERRQTTDVTTKNGINAIPNEQSPLWTIGWDKRSLRLKVMDKGVWSTFLLPKAANNNDPSHGWFTEWPRIREIQDGKFMMDMHGMFFNFPATFSATNTAGITPIGSHLRYVPDFTSWNGKLVLGTDQTSIQGNELAGQCQSSLWMGSFDELKKWGPSTGYGSIYLEDSVKAGTPSLPYLFSGFDNRVLHLCNQSDNAVKITLQLDIAGDNHWKNFKSINLAPNGYQYVLFDKHLSAAWIRIISSKAIPKFTATFHYTDASLCNTADGVELFDGLADSGYAGKVIHAKLYSNKNNFNLSAFTGDIVNGQFVKAKGYDLDKYSISFQAGSKDSVWAAKALVNKAIWSEDDASVILKADNYQLRLPKGKGSYLPDAYRNIREVMSERALANIHGTFYEVPLQAVDAEPLYKMMRPIATHNKKISDFNTWNGLLLMSGVRADAAPLNHIVKDSASNVALWMGGVDDLWKFGHPVGEGGPWKNSAVKANVLSDMYIMTGYDKKTLTLSSDRDVNISVLLHTTYYSTSPVVYKVFAVKAGQPITHKFPEGFSAHWIQVKADKTCVATAWLVYE
ncbi:MAG: hypothetical protein QM800_02170 [Paludibacter sp.]